MHVLTICYIAKELCQNTKIHKAFFKMNLLGWHWLIKLYRFQMYNSTTHHLYIVLCVHHPKSSLLPSPFIPLTRKRPSPSPTPITTMPLSCFYVGFLPNPPTPCPSDSHPPGLFSIYEYLPSQINLKNVKIVVKPSSFRRPGCNKYFQR